MIASCWKITLDPTGTPLVLVNYDEMLDREIEFNGTREASVVPKVRADYPLLRNGKNVSVSFSFRVMRPETTWPLARAAAMATALAALAKDKAPLRIEATGVSGYTQFSECLITDASSGLDEGEGMWHVTSYSLVAVNKSIVTP